MHAKQALYQLSYTTCFHTQNTYLLLCVYATSRVLAEEHMKSVLSFHLYKGSKNRARIAKLWLAPVPAESFTRPLPFMPLSARSLTTSH